MITDYASLKAEAIEWMDRAGQAGKAEIWVQLGEAKLNRKLGPMETDALLTATIGSRDLDIAGLDVVQPLALFIAEPGCAEITVQPQSASAMPYEVGPGRPEMFAVEQFSTIHLNRPADAAYSFRFHYRGRFALSEGAPTNWLLTNHPDVYLAVVLVWGAGYNEAWENGAIWKGTLEEAIPEIASLIRKSQRSTLRVDPALMAAAGRGTYNIYGDR
ncbi:hypothetical protein [Devosia sp. DBB001]|nr:hypothetical protein [Devosia sp. DBB001]